MRIILRLAQFFVVLFLVLAAIGFLLPQEQKVERSIIIRAMPEEVFVHLNGAKAFNEWSPWALLDENMLVTYTGPDAGKGSTMAWESEQPGVGSGSLTITDLMEYEQVDIALDFGGQGKAASYFKLQPVAEGTQVTWGFSMDAGMNPIHRWFGLMMDKWVGSDYEKGLLRLKKLIEGSAAQLDVPR
jgi:hypothetical protein